MKHKTHNAHDPKYSLKGDGSFVIENYNNASPFTNFFPGIAGLWGIPMWVFYVNRAQCISSFGVESKDGAIMEFHPANKAYRNTSLQGFRTFIKIGNGSKQLFYEPFQNNLSNSAFDVSQNMEITSHDLTIEEINRTLGLKITVNYFTLPDSPYAALVRNVTIKNLSKKKYSFEIIDGMPSVVPFGMKDGLLKHISRTIEAWVQVTNLKNKAPYFNLKVVVSDRPQVEHISSGNFYLSFLKNKTKADLLTPIVEPAIVFGTSYDFSIPELFLEKKSFKAPVSQKTKNKMPCAMSFATLKLSPGEQKTITSLIGHTHSINQINKIVSQAIKAGYIAKKKEKNKENIERIKNYVSTASSSNEFNLYCEQTFLDNVLRGGLPVSLETSKGKTPVNVFSRKHGDPERDYNYFVIAPTYLSQGNGNYRDVNQNRRSDAWFNKDVKDSNIINFLSLIQADGYNPLVVKGMTFFIDNIINIRKIVKKNLKGEGVRHIEEILQKGFTPGELLAALEQKDVQIKTSAKELLKSILHYCRKHETAVHGEGYWSDHWTYNTDLLESYFAMYPEARVDMLLKKDAFTFYHSPFYIRSRDERYILTDRGCRQYHSVAGEDKQAEGEGENKLRIHKGKGPVYHSNLAVKLLCVIANKSASLDPSGVGVEMEADKPNWYDALNGLPGLLGSSISETIELKRLCLFLMDSFEKVLADDRDEVRIFEELYYFINNLKNILSNEKDALHFWMRSNETKEHYRLGIRKGIDGQEMDMSVSSIKEFLKLVIAKTDQAIKKAKNKDGLLVTYFAHEVVEYEKLDKQSPEGAPYIWPLKFKRHNLPLFLEGFVHALRVEKNKENARKIYQNVRKSALFDRALNMYRVNADLSKESEEIGRARIFPAGWLENQSVWSHMEYKFLLELLRAGLYKEFYQNFKSALIPFLDPEVYGRSILENSSFIVSSAHEDSKLHGRGFVARLSGTTAELVHMWLMMNVGCQPFYLDASGELCLEFKPALPGWLFTTKEKNISLFDNDGKCSAVKIPKNSYAFKFLNSTLIVYNNPKRKDTFGANSAEIDNIVLRYSHSKKSVALGSKAIPARYAEDIREGKVDRLDVYLL